MAVQDFLSTYRQSMLNKRTINPLSSSNNSSIKIPRLGIRNTAPRSPRTNGFGSQVPGWLDAKKSSALESYLQGKGDRTSDLAQDYTDKAAGQVPTDKYGIPTDKLTDFNDYWNKNLSAIGNIGKTKLATDQAKADWHYQQRLKEESAGYEFSYTAPGASGKNRGSQAVKMALQVVKNKVPYVWGGNSLSRGVDCSGLVQQIYKKLGVNLPRTTYEQAKRGKVVPISSLLPGDLVFYNTGRSDPNGIGSLSHVAIYIGNGKVIDAPRRGMNVRITSLNNSGRPARAVRPW